MQGTRLSPPPSSSPPLCKGERNECQFLLLAIAFVLANVIGCGTKQNIVESPQDSKEPPSQLSSYGLFRGNGSSQEPTPGVVPYDVNTPLFSDYAHKLRFM